jgi:CDGSH-type Zn-finger protein
MTGQKKSQEKKNNTIKITVSKNGPSVATGSVPLIEEEIYNDDERYCRTWKKIKTYPVQEQDSLCRCGKSVNKPFCDGSHVNR